MPLDFFVMPLTRYYAGQFEAPASASKARPTVPPDEAQQLVAQIRDMLGSALGSEIRWNDSGDVLVADQLNNDFWHALRAYAANLTQPVPHFRYDINPQTHPGIAAVWQGTPSAHMHLIVQRDHHGYYFPGDFAMPMVLPIYPDADESSQPIVGSSDALLRELDDLGQRLGISLDQGQDGWTEQFQPDDPHEPVKWGWVFMHQCARLSVEHRLPIIFEG